MTTSRRPHTTINSISVFNGYTTDDNAWISSRITIGSWVLLQTRRRKRRQQNDFMEAFKGQVKEFKVCAQSKRVKEVLIQHAFHHADLRLQTPPPGFPRNRPNCKCFTLLTFDYYYGRVDVIMYGITYCRYPSNRISSRRLAVQCIVGIFDSFHAFIGEKMYRGRSHRELARNGIFFLICHTSNPK